MSVSFFAKAALSLAVAGAAVVPMSGTSFAASNTGTITVYDTNNVATNTTVLGYGRYVCIQMSPAVPMGGGWACVYGNPLYREQDELLLQGYLNKKLVKSNGLRLMQMEMS